MMTVAVATRQPNSQRRYRTVLGQLDVDAHFVTDSDLLIKCVRSRPVSVVIFDLDDPRWSARKWLEAAAMDVDLGVIPVLWIGTEVSRSDLKLIEGYQPGLHLPKLPDADVLLCAIQTLAGEPRQAGEVGLSASQSLAAPAWKPEVDTIDDALSIFADPASKQPLEASNRPVPVSARTANAGDTGSGVPAHSGGDYDVFVAEMTKTEQALCVPVSDPGFHDVLAPDGVENANDLSSPHSTRLDLAADEVPERDEDHLPMLEGIIPTGQPDAPQSSPAETLSNTTVSGAENALVDRIATEVAARLAEELVRNLDPTVIRRAVEAALAKP